MTARAIIVHSLDHARAAIAAAAEVSRPPAIWSAPGAGGYLGAPGFAAMLIEAAADHPEARFEFVLDCGDEAGTVMNALRHGVRTVCFHGPDAVRVRLAQMAAETGCAVIADRPADALDLLDEADPFGACRRWLDQGR